MHNHRCVTNSAQKDLYLPAGRSLLLPPWRCNCGVYHENGIVRARTLPPGWIQAAFATFTINFLSRCNGKDGKPQQARFVRPSYMT